MLCCFGFFSLLACLNALLPPDFCLVPELLNSSELLDTISGMFSPLYPRSPLRRDPGRGPRVAPASLLQQGGGDTPESVEGWTGMALALVKPQPPCFSPAVSEGLCLALQRERHSVSSRICAYQEKFLRQKY